jgi:hypothetical protein
VFPEGVRISALTTANAAREFVRLRIASRLFHTFAERVRLVVVISSPWWRKSFVSLRLLIQFAHGARADPRNPQRLGDIYDSSHTQPGQILFDQGFFH